MPLIQNNFVARNLEVGLALEQAPPGAIARARDRRRGVDGAVGMSAAVDRSDGAAVCARIREKSPS